MARGICTDDAVVLFGSFESCDWLDTCVNAEADAEGFTESESGEFVCGVD
jgi:hypothetical protein